MCARLGLLTAVLWLTVSSATAAPPESTTEIPLKEVWALRMPGTRDIAELEVPPGGMRYGPLTDEIRRYALGSKRFREQIKNRKILGYQNTAFGPRPIYSVPPLKPAGQGFAVPGDNSLREAHAVLAKDAKRPEVITGPVTLVFYSLRAGSYVYLDKIERDGFTITITYHLQSHMTTDSTSHFALIPLGQLPSGKYAVKIERQGETWKNSQEIVDAIICKPFQFEIK